MSCPPKSLSKWEKRTSAHLQPGEAAYSFHTDRFGYSLRKVRYGGWQLSTTEYLPKGKSKLRLDPYEYKTSREALDLLEQRCKNVYGGFGGLRGRPRKTKLTCKKTKRGMVCTAKKSRKRK